MRFIDRLSLPQDKKYVVCVSVCMSSLGVVVVVG